MKIRSVLITLAIASVATFAQAQASRTWVSGVGDDVNPCSRTAPCKTFPGAISKTAVGGEIDVLDPGGFGTVTITKAITLDGHPFQAGLLSSGVNAINVSAGTSEAVVLRHLNIVGLNNSPVGVQINSAGSVSIEDCTISQFNTAGVRVNGSTGARVRLNIYNTLIRNNAGDGVQIFPTLPQFVVLNMTNDRVFANTGGGVNIASNAQTTASIQFCSLSTNSNAGVSNGGLVVQNGNVTMTHCDVSGNPFGIFMVNGTLRYGFNTITNNTTDGVHISGGTAASFGANYISGNAGNETGNGTSTKH